MINENKPQHIQNYYKQNLDVLSLGQKSHNIFDLFTVNSQHFVTDFLGQDSEDFQKLGILEILGEKTE